MIYVQVDRHSGPRPDVDNTKQRRKRNVFLLWILFKENLFSCVLNILKVYLNKYDSDLNCENVK